YAVVARTHGAKEFMPLHVRQAKIENNQIRRLRAQQFESHFAVGCFKSFIAMRRKPDAQQFANRRFVINDEKSERSRAHAAASSRCGSLAIGNLMVKAAPRPSGRLVAMMVPFIASTKPREIARPSPVPGRI